MKSLEKTVKRAVKAAIPASLRRNRKIHAARKKLGQIAHQPCRSEQLLPSNEIDLDGILHSTDRISEWAGIETKLKKLMDMAPSAAQSDGNRGVNPGDQRAIYHLIRALNPKNILEVGTNVGFSTLHIAAALDANGAGARITTVDITDVNDPNDQPWKGCGQSYAPRDMLAAGGYGEMVNFVAQSSLEYLDTCKDKFDFIFLDGSHDAEIVYQEVPKAIEALAKGGVILLHDFYAGLTFLWDNKKIIPGPCIAIERLCTEGAALKVIPFGALPWKTKGDSHMTSLALLVRQ
jgi:predicted O-methyltransferase YrrM